MSDIRHSTSSRLRLNVDTPKADDNASTTTSRLPSPSATAQTSVSTSATSAVTATDATSSARVGSTRAAAEATTSAPTTPIAATTAENTSGAASFASSLQLIDYRGSDSDSMTAAFMKLEAQSLSTNQDIEGLLNLAKHHLRDAAFKIERALANQDPNALLAQADQAEQQAMETIQAAIDANGGAEDPDNAQLLAALEGLGGDDGDVSASSGANQGDLATDAWKSLYDSAGRQLALAAQASKEADDATAKGDTAAAQAARGRAEDYEAKARTILEAAGIDVSTKDAEAMGKLALEMKANGDNSNVITAYVGKHPEVVQSLLTPEEYAAVKDKGGQAIVDAVMTAQAAKMGGGTNEMTLGLAASAADQTALNELMEQYPAAGAIQGALSQAADLMEQAYELRIRAYQMHEALLDAQNAIHEGKTDDGQFGVANRNARGQQEILRGLFALTGGTRPDQQSRNEAANEAARSRSEVSKLLLEYVDKKAESTRNRFIRS